MKKDTTWKSLNYYLDINNITYQEYLQSEHWKDLRKRKKKSNCPYICYICGTSKGLNLHHKTYKRIGHEWLMDMIWLCSECHTGTHQYAKNTPLRHGSSLRHAARSIKKQIAKGEKSRLPDVFKKKTSITAHHP